MPIKTEDLSSVVVLIEARIDAAMRNNCTSEMIFQLQEDKKVLDKLIEESSKNAVIKITAEAGEIIKKYFNSTSV